MLQAMPDIDVVYHRCLSLSARQTSEQMCPPRVLRPRSSANNTACSLNLGADALPCLLSVVLPLDALLLLSAILSSSSVSTTHVEPATHSFHTICLCCGTSSHLRPIITCISGEALCSALREGGGRTLTCVHPPTAQPPEESKEGKQERMRRMDTDRCSHPPAAQGMGKTT